ncbi:hypothetical protein MRX96_006615 [Rhipicephalus microplus]
MPESNSLPTTVSRVHYKLVRLKICSRRHSRSSHRDIPVFLWCCPLATACATTSALSPCPSSPSKLLSRPGFLTSTAGEGQTMTEAFNTWHDCGNQEKWFKDSMNSQWCIIEAAGNLMNVNK